jgi:hypothetical protein
MKEVARLRAGLTRSAIRRGLGLEAPLQTALAELRAPLWKRDLRNAQTILQPRLLASSDYADALWERFFPLNGRTGSLKVDVIVPQASPLAWPPSKRPRLSPLSLFLASRLRAGSSPALRGRAAMSRACPSSPRS